MYSRIYNPLKEKSFFLFGPRATGKTTWLNEQYKGVLKINLLEAHFYNQLLAQPSKLQQMLEHLPPGAWVIIDEIQKVPALLDEVHHLIESKKLRFALTGSSARKLKRGGANLLAGRALQKRLYPLTEKELNNDYNLKAALKWGLLPPVWIEKDKEAFLKTYVSTFLKEEVQAEGLTRNLPGFARFLETISFSQGQALNISTVARDAAIDRKVVESYIGILEDLLIAYRIPVFSKKAKRRMTVHPKFFYFDVGIYRTLRPKGPLDSAEEMDGPALETLFLNHLKAYIEALALDLEIFFWRSADKNEVDFVLYGESGFYAFEIKRGATLRGEDLRPIKEFRSDYPQAKTFLFYGGSREYMESGVQIVPFEKGLKDLMEILQGA